jgi:sortase A
MFLTAAFVLAAYLAWELWGTSFYTAQQQGSLDKEINAQLEDPRRRPPPVVPGHAYAVIGIPETDLQAVVVQGTDVGSLTKGPGHYLESRDPWDRRGPTAIAGHRTTYGAWFWDLDKLERGDRIALYTERGTFRYRVTDSRIVYPTPDVARDVFRTTKNTSLVLTTCHPRFSAAQRLIVFAKGIDPGSGSGPSLQIGGPPPEGSVDLAESPAVRQARAILLGIAGGVAFALLIATVVAVRRHRRRPAERAP